MKTTLTARNYLRQAPQIINGKFSFTKSETDLVFALLTEINLEDKDFKRYSITKKQLEVKMGVKIKTDRLKSTAESLMSKVLKIEKSEDNWELFTLFSYFGYKNGVLSFCFDAVMKPYLLQLKPFISADIRHLVQMKSEYSKRLYLMLKERQKFGTRKFDIEELKELFEVPKSLNNYADFKRRVLLQAVRDINKFTDIEVANLGTAKKPIYFEEFKPSRKVVSVTFHFNKNHIDLKAFISNIRALHTNEPLYAGKDGRMLQCSEKGLLYYKDDVFEYLDKKKAQKAWEFLHEHRESLICFNQEVTEPHAHYLHSKEAFITYMKENFRDRELLSVKDRNTQKLIVITLTKEKILKNKITDENFDTSYADSAWIYLYQLAKKGELRILQTSKSSV
jgi:hypothetical protein